MNYQKLYDSLMSTGKQRGNKKRKGFDLHHVVPTCMGGNDGESNKALLTFREHFVVHRILTKIYPGHSGLHYAVWRMIHGGGKYKFTGRTHETAKLNRSQLLSQRHKSLTEKNQHNWQSEKSKDRVRKWHKFAVADGSHPSQRLEFRLMQTERNAVEVAEGRHPFQSDSHSIQASANASGRNSQILTCPCCNEFGGGTNMKRYHFDNCLQHPDNLGLTRKQIKARRQAM